MSGGGRCCRPPMTAGLKTYRTDVGMPDYATTVPAASSDYVIEDVGSCSPRFIRMTMSTLPTDKEARNKAAIPVAAVVQPLARPGPGEAPVPLVDMGPDGPIRCAGCRSMLARATKTCPALC